MIAIGDNCNPELWEKDYNNLGTELLELIVMIGILEGNDPAGISTQDPKLDEKIKSC